MPAKAKIIGVHSVEADEPVHLIDLLVEGDADDFDIGEITQAVGNGRAHELLRRAADPNSSIKPNTKVPVAPYTPDMSMFPDLP
jgi:hypothetical protein